MATAPRKILLTGGRSYVTLDLARQLKASGCEIYVAETRHMHVCRYSNAVTRSFTIPSPRFNGTEFIEALSKIIIDNDIDLLIPTCEETFYISQALNSFPPSCRVFVEPFKKLEPLHSKWKFIQTLKGYGFAAPETYLVHTKEELERIPFTKPYILKACYCRASQLIPIVHPPTPPPALPLEPHNPWVAQEMLYGSKFCSYSIAHNGKLTATSVYPVEYSIGGNSCLTFKPVHHQGIIDWISKLVEKLDFTGQIGFDFIQTLDGTLYAIECNPRATSGIHLFKQNGDIADAFFNTGREMIVPVDESLKQIAVGMLMYGWRSQPNFPLTWKQFAKTLFGSKDVIFCRTDPKPFLFSPRIAFMYWKMSQQLRKPMPAIFTHDIEWNNEQREITSQQSPAPTL